MQEVVAAVVEAVLAAFGGDEAGEAGEAGGEEEGELDHFSFGWLWDWWICWVWRLGV
jgi:hypothetical protein